MSRPITSPRFAETAVLIRQEEGTYNRYGEWEPGEETRTEVVLTSAPLSPAARREDLPEGARIENSRRFWLEEPVEPVRTGEGATEGDVIEYAELRWRVKRVQDFRPHGFVEVLAVREEGQDG